MSMSGTTRRMVRPTGFLVALCLAALRWPLLPAQAQKPIARPPTGREGSDQHEPTDPAKDIPKLKAEVRQLKAQLNELQMQNKARVGYLTFAPEMDLQDEDYAQARRRFRTKLLRKGPSPQPWSPAKPPADVTEVEYTSGALRLKAWVNRPTDVNHKRPAVLFLHGGFAFGMGDWDQAKPYRDAGFVVMTPMLRGENGQPGAFSYFYDEVDDVLAAAAYLSKQPYVDANRLFLAGHSVGGTMTLLTALTSNRFRAAASFDGAPYWPPFYEATDLPFDKSGRREILLRSPIAYATRFKCPLRIYHHVMDGDFLAEVFGFMSQRTVALAKSRGLDVEEVGVEGDHMTHVPAAMRQSIAFFERISSQEIAPWSGEPAPLPKTLELDLGGGVKMRLARIEPGKFRMGSPPSEAGRSDDEAQHEVDISRPYCLGQFLVTQAQYRQVTGTNPSKFSRKGDDKDRVFGLDTDDFPVENVSWEDAMDFCRIVSLLPSVRDSGWVVDLPTEAEWEYACRAGTETAFGYGNALSSQQANFNGDSPYGGAPKGEFLQRPTKVGDYAPNAWGLFDMHGNVFQWCKDIYDANYEFADKKNASDRVARGGAFFLPAQECRSARRLHFRLALRSSATINAPPIGFRVVVRPREK